MERFGWIPESRISVIGAVSGVGDVFIQLWRDTQPIFVSSSGCGPIGDTGRYAWALNQISALDSPMEQFHWRMSNGSDEDQGDFILEAIGGMPSLTRPQDYIVGH